MFDGKTEKTQQSLAIEEIAIEKHLYTIDYEGRKSYTVENYFSRIESDVEGIINRISDSNSLVSIDNKDFHSLLEFISFLIARTPKRVELTQAYGTGEAMRKIIQTKAKNKVPDSEVDSFLNVMMKTKGYVYASTLQSIVEDFMDKLKKYFDGLLSSTRTGAFILNDNYAAIERPSTPLFENTNSNWWEQPVRIHCPLTSKLCLTFIPKKCPQDNDFHVSVQELEEEKVEEINKLIFDSRSRFVYASSSSALENIALQS
ncbi:Protein of unknown function [Nitrosovibrio sp. Nv6]|nr:Protein of unknown function [Nitrosovibrio sp. Nv6]